MRTTPTTDRGRASQARIVDAACDLFYRQGVFATSLTEIIEASGTGKGQLYFFFEDKADLILEVIAAQIDSVLAPLGARLDLVHTADDLRDWAREVVAQHQQDAPARCPLGALIVELADNEPRARAALDEGFARWRDTLATALERLREHGEISSDADASDLAELLLCAYEGGIILSEVRGTTRPLELAFLGSIEALL